MEFVCLFVPAAPARFEELEFADEGSYMVDGRIVFTGSPPDLRQFLRLRGSPV